MTSPPKTCYPLYYTHTHTHPFNGPFSGTTQVSRYQKGKTNLDFTEARDSVWQWHQLGHMQVCTLLQTDNHTSTPPLYFLQARCPSCHPTNSVKALKAYYPLYYCTSFVPTSDTVLNYYQRLYTEALLWELLYADDLAVIAETEDDLIKRLIQTDNHTSGRII